MFVPLFMIWLIGLGVSFAIGMIVSDGKLPIGLICLLVWALAGGVMLALIWAVFTISAFFGIPIVVVIALVIIAWFILGRVRR